MRETEPTPNGTCRTPVGVSERSTKPREDGNRRLAEQRREQGCSDLVEFAGTLYVGRALMSKKTGRTSSSGTAHVAGTRRRHCGVSRTRLRNGDRYAVGCGGLRSTGQRPNGLRRARTGRWVAGRPSALPRCRGGGGANSGRRDPTRLAPFECAGASVRPSSVVSPSVTGRIGLLRLGRSALYGPFTLRCVSARRSALRS